MTNKSSVPVWSSLLPVGEVPAHGLETTLIADEGVRRRLAAEDGVLAIASVEAHMRVTRRGRDRLHVLGQLRARLMQTCVVSLEPFEAEIVEPIDVEFAPPPAAAPRDPRQGARRGRSVPEQDQDAEGMDDLDAPDEIVDGKIDLGALAAEHLALGIDPYPRKPGIAFAEPAEPPKRESPFASLGSLVAGPGGKTGR